MELKEHQYPHHLLAETKKQSNTLRNTLASNDEVLKLTMDNAKLTSWCMKIECENKNLCNRVSSLEDKFLSNNIIMSGIAEEEYE